MVYLWSVLASAFPLSPFMVCFVWAIIIEYVENVLNSSANWSCMSKADYFYSVLVYIVFILVTAHGTQMNVHLSVSYVMY